MESVVGIGIKLIRYTSTADGTGDGEFGLWFRRQLHSDRF